ACHSSNVP
ncbi:Xanthine phosphoribosyltransferase, partial [Haemophilus influenzae]